MLTYFYFPIIISTITFYIAYILMTRCINLSEKIAYESISMSCYLILPTALLIYVAIQVNAGHDYINALGLCIAGINMGYYLFSSLFLLIKTKKFNVLILHHVCFFIIFWVICFEGQVYYVFALLPIQQYTGVIFHGLKLIPDRLESFRIKLSLFNDVIFFLLRIVGTMIVTFYLIYVYFYYPVATLDRVDQFILPIILLLNNGMNFVWFVKQVKTSPGWQLLFAKFKSMK